MQNQPNIVRSRKTYKKVLPFFKTQESDDEDIDIMRLFKRKNDFSDDSTDTISTEGSSNEYSTSIRKRYGSYINEETIDRRKRRVAISDSEYDYSESSVYTRHSRPKRHKKLNHDGIPDFSDSYDEDKKGKSMPVIKHGLKRNQFNKAKADVKRNEHSDDNSEYDSYDNERQKDNYDDDYYDEDEYEIEEKVHEKINGVFATPRHEHGNETIEYLSDDNTPENVIKGKEYKRKRHDRKESVEKEDSDDHSPINDDELSDIISPQKKGVSTNIVNQQNEKELKKLSKEERKRKREEEKEERRRKLEEEREKRRQRREERKEKIKHDINENKREDNEVSEEKNDKMTPEEKKKEKEYWKEKQAKLDALRSKIESDLKRNKELRNRAGFQPRVKVTQQRSKFYEEDLLPGSVTKLKTSKFLEQTENEKMPKRKKRVNNDATNDNFVPSTFIDEQSEEDYCTEVSLSSTTTASSSTTSQTGNKQNSKMKVSKFLESSDEDSDVHENISFNTLTRKEKEKRNSTFRKQLQEMKTSDLSLSSPKRKRVVAKL